MFDRQRSMVELDTKKEGLLDSVPPLFYFVGRFLGG